MLIYLTLASTKLGASLEILVMLTGAFGLGYLFHYVLSRGLMKRINNLENQLRHITYRYETAEADQEKTERNLKRLKTKYDRFKWESEQAVSHEKEWGELKQVHKKDEKKIRNLEKERQVLQEQVDELKVQLLQANMQQAVAEIVHKKDDLKVITGIGPKIEKILHEHDIFTYSQLAKSSVKKLKTILAETGGRYASFDPSQWPKDARAVKGKGKAKK
jgi:predicted flap endonuclease-1-like 5' DNA nuclease